MASWGWITSNRRTVEVGAAALVAASLMSGCGSSAPQGCADIEKAMMPLWESINTFVSYRDAGTEPPASWASAHGAAEASAVRDLRKISAREVGEVANLAELLIYAQVGPKGAARDDAGIAGYLLLKRVCNLTPPD